MTLDLLAQATFAGPAFTEPFVRYELEHELAARKLLPREAGAEGRELQASWEIYRRYLRELVALGGAVRVRNHVLEPLVGRLGYAGFEPADDVATREGQEPGGFLMLDGDGSRLRMWATDFGEDLDAPARRGRAYRFSHSRIAQRVLLATGEQVGLLTNGLELRLLISNPAGRDSLIEIHIDPQWKRSRDVPDTYRLLLALASPAGIRAVPDLVEKARLQQTRVTKELRVQARQAVERFVQEVLDQPDNAGKLAAITDRGALARQLWHEGLVLVYRLLFILKAEASDDPAQGFSFASTSLWRNTFSPSVALAPYARAVLDGGAETGGLLESGLRSLFRMFEDGLACTELNVKPLGGFLFGANRAPLLSDLRWGERAVAHLLDRLLWTSKRRGSEARERVHYGPLDVKDLGRVYEALLELEPGIAGQSMCRLRRAKLEVVIPLAQGVRYQGIGDRGQGAGGRSRVLDAQRPDAELEGKDLISDTGDLEPDNEPDEEDDLTPDTRNPKPNSVEWVEEIPAGRFYLRVGLGRKSSGSFYTPDSFVTFLVRETLGPLVEGLSPHDDPRPLAILSLKVGDDACGSGHFLVESDRFLGDKLYEACRACDERALEAERALDPERSAEGIRSDVERQKALAEAAAWRQRVTDLPDPNDELLTYLPSRAPEGAESGLSQRKALALCKRLVAVHCLYGVDKNPLAVELARLALWIETQAEGLPLTFLDHRIVAGDSLTGPFFEQLLTLPGSQKPLEGLWSQGLTECFTAALGEALVHVRDLEATVGATLAEITAKQAAKTRLDRALAPFRIVAAAWAGGVMLGPPHCDDEAYRRLVRAVAEDGVLPDDLSTWDALRAMIARGLGVEDIPTAREELFTLLASGRCVPALPFELVFPEVFFPTGDLADRRGFHATLGNPPWDQLEVSEPEFWSSFDLRILEAPTVQERKSIQKVLLGQERFRELWGKHVAQVEEAHHIHDVLFAHQVVEVDGRRTAGRPDLYRLFAERASQLLVDDGYVGLIIPSAFHVNEGASGVRRLYLTTMSLSSYFVFENRRKLFEIDGRFKFAVLVAQRGQHRDASFKSAFYLQDPEWLFSKIKVPPEIDYHARLTRAMSPDYLNLIEFRSPADVTIAEVCYSNSETFEAFCHQHHLSFGVGLEQSRDYGMFTPAADILKGQQDARDPLVCSDLNKKGYLVLHQGKTFNQFTDQWGLPPENLVHISKVTNHNSWFTEASYYKMAFRRISNATNERTYIFALLPPGVLVENNAPAEFVPSGRPNSAVLLTIGLFNAFTTDWLGRLRVSAFVSLRLLRSQPIPDLKASARFIAHSALKLNSNHAGYAPLWREQLGDAWREPSPLFTWPVLAGDDARWAVRVAIDAVVAQAYGLDREQYAHVISTFSHKSYPKAPTLCLERFDELAEIGLDAFARKWDPYWDVPLNEALPEPVIEIEVPGDRGQGAVEQLGLGI